MQINRVPSRGTRNGEGSLGEFDVGKAHSL